MPLEKKPSKEAFQKNVKEEMKSKPQDQAVAIAYEIKRNAEAKRKGKK